uniref:Neurensin 1-like n=1 Tax=Periophthalmus magnuspinnatus TaxID=409849 RepID=A0A3B4AGY0_9GOBI
MGRFGRLCGASSSECCLCRFTSYLYRWVCVRQPPAQSQLHKQTSVYDLFKVGSEHAVDGNGNKTRGFLAVLASVRRIFLIFTLFFLRPKSVVSVVSPQVSVALGLLILTAGVASLSVGYSTPHKIESFGEGDLFFVDTQAINFNRGLHQSRAAGIGLSCLGVALAAMGLAVWVLPRADWKTRLFHRAESGEGRGEWAPKWMGFSDGGDVVTKPPVLDEKKVPVTLSKVENVQPAS